MAITILQEVKEHIRADALDLWKEAVGIDFDLSVPDVAAHGDCATNIAMHLAKRLGVAPAKIAEQLVAHIEMQAWYEQMLEKIEIKKPGFINFFLKPAYLTQNLKTLIASLKQIEYRSEKIVIEHTNVNPNKAMHIGHLRNAVLGDVITRVMQRAGFQTEVQYYVDDTGVQVADTYLASIVIDQSENTFEKFDHYAWMIYALIGVAYEERPELLEKRKDILRELENSDSDVAKKVKEVATRILNAQLETTRDFGITYDLLVWESDILKFAFWNQAFEILKKSSHVIKETEGKNIGCWVLKTGEEQADDEHSPDKILVRSDGTVTYTGKDIAYHLWKFDLLGNDFLYSEWKESKQTKSLFTTDAQGKKSSAFGHADRVYNVIDVRQSYPQAMVKLALEILGFSQQAEKLRHVSYNVVSLTSKAAATFGAKFEDGKSVLSMSGRKGIGVKVDDVLKQLTSLIREQRYEVQSSRDVAGVTAEEVAVGALKYFMLRYNPQTEIVFDFDEALSLQGNTGVYLQYAHARAAGILEKVGATRMPAKINAAEMNEAEARLLKKLYLWPEISAQVAVSLNVNDICTYAFELANTFNAFYEVSPVAKAAAGEKERRVALVFAFKEVLGDILHMIGIVAPEKM